MGLLPVLFGARRRNTDAAPVPEPLEDELRNDVFRLIPPRAETVEASDPLGTADAHPLPELTLAERLERLQAKLPVAVVEPEPPAAPALPETSKAPETPATPAPLAQPGRDVRPVGAMDLTRLSIDNDGRLYWDGKPVEVRRRLMMSRAQILGDEPARLVHRHRRHRRCDPRIDRGARMGVQAWMGEPPLQRAGARSAAAGPKRHSGLTTPPASGHRRR